MSLAYNDFRHWSVSKARLHVAFQGLPGEKRVKAQRYYLIDKMGKLLTSDNWLDEVAPRARIAMSVVLHGTSAPGCCPAC